MLLKNLRQIPCFSWYPTLHLQVVPKHSACLSAQPNLYDGHSSLRPAKIKYISYSNTPRDFVTIDKEEKNCLYMWRLCFLPRLYSLQSTIKQQ
jgi:hypothetical protein